MSAVWFIDNGIGVFPIKTRSKEPACRSWDDFVSTREDAARYKNYGVRLATWIGVIDTDSPESEAFIGLQISTGVIPNTPFVVRGARGLHRYYRLRRAYTPKFLHREGLTIEFRNAGQYVVGPGSIHPSGVVYTAAEWSWTLTDVPFFPDEFVFDDRPGAANFDGRQINTAAYVFPDEVTSGERHDALFKLLRSFKALGNDYESTRVLISLANQNRCNPPLKENHTFEAWCKRAWDNPDRPLATVDYKKSDPSGIGDLI